ncbi:hypothetical protein MKT60_016775 [Providencia rettgeri]|uniref:hypothetical protein n=1 Tax=Providencia TaxID=586 RepID=UPI001EE6E87C|nr:MULTISPECIES: hypothetical protein [Providencia]EMC8779198.1 hypothetical protein [Providencia rettgeri]MCG5371569.1 hypothetical protein [Providencia rettgeri]MCL0008507.1 hypothetical protein [Providencia rettgeri]
MSHEIELSVAAKKSAQLSSLLFTINKENLRHKDTSTIEELIGLALDLSNDVSLYLLEENAQRDNGHE